MRVKREKMIGMIDTVGMKLSDYANFNVISHHFLEQWQ